MKAIIEYLSSPVGAKVEIVAQTIIGVGTIVLIGLWLWRLWD